MVVTCSSFRYNGLTGKGFPEQNQHFGNLYYVTFCAPALSPLCIAAHASVYFYFYFFFTRIGIERTSLQEEKKKKRKENRKEKKERNNGNEPTHISPPSGVIVL